MGPPRRRTGPYELLTYSRHGTGVATGKGTCPMMGARLCRRTAFAAAKALRQGFRDHERQTREHVRRLERTFKSLDASPAGRSAWAWKGC
jgi:hypothetical protein